MPRSNNGHRATVNSSANLVSQRLARRVNGFDDPKRLKLLAEILDESSSPKLNDSSSLQLGPRQVAENHSKLLDQLEQLRQLEQDLNPKLPSRSEENWTKFFKWIDDNSATKLSDKVNVSKQSLGVDGGRQDDDEYSLIAQTPFKKGDKIFVIDRKLLLSTETATNDLDLNDFIKKDSIAPGMQNVVLVLHLLNEHSKQDQSFWWPYLSILPGKILPILKSTKQSLAQYFLASAHIYEALKLLRSIARQYSYFYQRLQSTRLPLRKDFTFEYYAWGVSCVCSRQNEIPLGPSSRGARFAVPYHNAHALIPVLDMCNHNARSNQALFLDNSSCLIADRDLNASDEISINYGGQSRSSGEFYIHNGFVPELLAGSGLNNSNMPSYYDVVPMTIGLSKNNKLFERKAKLLKILNMPTFGRFKLVLNTHENRHKRDPHLSMFLIVYSLDERELDMILDDPNPVGVADEVYEHVHYKDKELEAASDAGASCDKQAERAQMKRRVAQKCQRYLNLRANVSIALIDRTLDEAKKLAQIDHYAIRLLQCERRIFESYTTTAID